METIAKSRLWLWNIAAVAMGGIPVALYPLVRGLVPDPLAAGWETLPFQALSLLQQWQVMLYAFGIKPLYMALTFLLIAWIWRQKAADLTALRWGLIWFWVGETGCSIDYLFYAQTSDFWEYAHGFGMVVGFSFIAYAALEGADRRLIKFSPKGDRCAALGLCRACEKYTDDPCGLKRLFKFMIPGLMAVAFIPLTAPFQLNAFRTELLGSPHFYRHMVSSQWFELRVAPIMALLFLGAAWMVLLFKRHEPVPVSKALMAAGTGPLGFALMRMSLAATFNWNWVWLNFWEEFTELLFIIAALLVLWTFRHRLLPGALLTGGKRAEVASRAGPGE
jgi:hypothetical protein